jgi:hypothetical protein
MILLVSASRDFATDYVIAQLLDRGAPYIRIDLDLLASDQICLDPVAPCLTVTRESRTTILDPATIRAIYYRAPTHLRESSGARYQPAELLARHQWAAFSRSLMVFDTARWMNHPWQTYRAESKPYQLRVAAKVGFQVPETRICNALPSQGDAVWRNAEKVAVKAVDTFLLRVTESEDAFFYTQTLRADELECYSVSEMPIILQELVEPKVDLRVTVVGDHVFPVAIRCAGRGIAGDWRPKKDVVSFESCELPQEVRTACIRLLRELGLVFGAVDLVVCDDRYYFLEINPTGEWAWLVDRLGLPISEVIADALASG